MKGKNMSANSEYIKKIRFIEDIQLELSQIKTILEQIQILETSPLSKQDIESCYIAIASITQYLKLIRLYISINNKYQSVFNRNNEEYLDQMRKYFIFITQKMKASFGTQVSISLTQNTKFLQQLKKLTPTRLLHLLQQLDFSLLSVKKLYPKTSKYNVVHVNTYNDIIGFTLNASNFKEYFSIIRNLQHPQYEEIRELLNFIIKLLDKCSNMWMELYTLNHSKEAVQYGIKVLEQLENIMRLSNHEDLSEITRKKNSWNRYL